MLPANHFRPGYCQQIEPSTATRLLPAVSARKSKQATDAAATLRRRTTTLLRETKIVPWMDRRAMLPSSARAWRRPPPGGRDRASDGRGAVRPPTSRAPPPPALSFTCRTRRRPRSARRRPSGWRASRSLPCPWGESLSSAGTTADRGSACSCWTDDRSGAEAPLPRHQPERRLSTTDPPTKAPTGAPHGPAKQHRLASLPKRYPLPRNHQFQRDRLIPRIRASRAAIPT